MFIDCFALPNTPWLEISKACTSCLSFLWSVKCGTLMVTVILMSYFFRSCSLCWVAIYCEWPPMPVNTLFFWVSWMAQQRKTSRFLACLALVPTTLPLILLTLSARHNFPTAGISLGTWRWRYFNLCQEHPIWINGWLSIGWSAKSFTWEMVGNHWKSPNIH